MTVLPSFPEGSVLSRAQKLGAVLVVYWLIWLVYAKILHPLAKVPGPLWPSLSRTWLMVRMYYGDYHIAQVALHDKYGPLIRIAPNELSYSKPDGVPVIYRLSRPLEKTDWYWAWKGAGLKSQINMFTITDEKMHTAYRRVVGTVYSLSNILKNEKKMDENVQLLLGRLDGFVERKEEVDLGLWLEMYAYDNIGSVFGGKPFGFLETGSDYGGYIAAVHKAMPFLSVVTMAPSYARTALMAVAATVPSLLRAVLAVDGIRKTSVAGEMWVAVIAGADSTAGGLRAVIYHLLKYPRVMVKLTAEVDEAFKSGTLTHPVQHAQVISLP
ncbi:hypothetical protein E8E12_005412 [Didymella heteroderae]|uniref:Cytochrome P450 n=1 Tax=Didymella heteroderae TaxID=1769908 RepID=A0A9P4WMH4_9PLEO|nr:hypothetical protein E8E12_005412 [Didymella heteroderae]